MKNKSEFILVLVVFTLAVALLWVDFKYVDHYEEKKWDAAVEKMIERMKP